MLRKVSLLLLAPKIYRFSPLLFTASHLSLSLLYSNVFRRISFQYLLSSHLTLIAGIHCTIWVALIADFTLPQVTVVSDFGVAGMTAACETTVRVCTCVLAWAVQTLVHICNKEKQVLYGNVWTAHSSIMDQPRKANRQVMCVHAWIRFVFSYDFVFKMAPTNFKHFPRYWLVITTILYQSMLSFLWYNRLP